ncbi:MAG: aminopeptidase P family protein [Phycisphaerales bacterium]|nr:aminopeptidase P family protein [Phycisphaerales bacterium]
MNIPAISNIEFAQRIERARQLTQAAGYDALLVNSNEADLANVRYFSDFWPIFEIAGVLIPVNGQPALLIGPESEAFARDRSKIPTVHKMLEYRESADPAYPGVAVKTFKQVFAEAGAGEPRRIGIGGYLVTTAPVLDGLRQAFPKAQIERADQIMFQLRGVKSEGEIACLKKAFEISEKAAQRVVDEIRVGMTELQVVGLAQQAIYELGAEYEGHPTYILSGRSSRHAISRPTHKVIEKGELVQLNVGARVAGYSSSVGLPVCMGTMSTQQRELVEFGLKAHNWTAQQLKAGVIAADIARAYKKFFADNGMSHVYLYGPCHSVGMVEVEPPWMEEISQYPLAQNMTFQVDTFCSAADMGLRFENGGRITASGFEPFTGKLKKVVEL